MHTRRTSALFGTARFIIQGSLLAGLVLPFTVACGAPDAPGESGKGNDQRTQEHLDPAASDAITNLYNAWGGAGSGLGSPTTDVLPTPDGIGAFQQYQSGAIYWTAATGAHMVLGAIRDKWAEVGWETGFLGYPTQDSAGAPDGVGIFSYFQGGAIYWTPDTGAHEVHGAILQRWGELGWETGALGYPTSDEMASDAGGRMSTFQNGTLYWLDCTGVTDTLQACPLISTGDCFSDADCTNGATCNNPSDNPQGNCMTTRDSYPGDALAPIHWTGGADFNSCATDAVANDLAEMDQGAYTQVSYDQREGDALPPDGHFVPRVGGLGGDCSISAGLEPGLPWDHVQSLVRIPGSADQRWMAASIDTHDDARRGGIMFIELGALNGNNGEPFRAGRSDDRGANRTQAFYQLPAEHPGGMQMLGHTLAVAVDHDLSLNQPAVYFIDASNPVGKSVDDAVLQVVPLGSMPYPAGVSAPTALTAVAVVPMNNGGFLMAANSGSSVWLYLTDYVSIGRNTHWYFHNQVNIANGPGAENITFVTECDGSVWLLTASNQQGGSLGENGIGNSVNIHRLVKNGDKLSISLFGNRNSFINDGYGDFRASATFYVSPNGELALYAASRNIVCRDGNFKMAEYLIPQFCGLGGC